MATYLIEGTVTAWPEGTALIEIYVETESFSNNSNEVNLNTGLYSLPISADPGEKVWINFYSVNFDEFIGQPGADDKITAQKTFGPFIIDDIGVLL